MFIGHFGVGLGAKKINDRPSLGTLFLAAQFLDLLWPMFLLMGIEKVKIEPGITTLNPLNFTYYPFSHSLFFAFVWSLLFGAVYFLLKKNIKTSILLGLLVMSHWVLDLIVHIPDLPLSPWSDVKVGFGLWDSVALTIIVEGFIFAAGIYYYLKVTKSKNKKGQIGFWSLIIFLLIIYILNFFGSAPPSVNAIAVAGLFQWLIILWGYWIDSNRKPVHEMAV
jgi:LexA-binding, inner membrane-associated putative hydrolase